MIYPKFLDSNSTIGICAPSMGVGDKITDYNKSIDKIKSEGYKIVETKSVRNKGITSNSKEIRGKEFNELLTDENIDMIMMARGGEFLLSCLPFIDFSKINNYPKWVMGYSDPTSILFCLTTKYDIATIYGFNATNYDEEDKCLKNNLEIIKGNIIKQNSFATYITEDGSEEKVKWLSNNENIDITGRIIGGCVEVLRDIAGTVYEDVNGFNEHYQNDGIIWYFDICEMTGSEFYNTLLKFQYLNWFQNIKGIILSRISSPIENYITYEDAIREVFPNIPYILDADIGHTFPKMTIISGSIAHLKCENNKGSLEFKLK